MGLTFSTLQMQPELGCPESYDHTKTSLPKQSSLWPEMEARVIVDNLTTTSLSPHSSYGRILVAIPSNQADGSLERGGAARAAVPTIFETSHWPSPETKDVAAATHQDKMQVSLLGPHMLSAQTVATFQDSNSFNAFVCSLAQA